MSVSTSTYTANSVKITISNELSSTNIIPALDQSMAKGGWALYDTVATTTFSPIVTKVYRAINADTLTYKYMIMRINTINLTINTSSCESWDAVTTHLPTNETWHGAGAFPQGYDLKDSVILVSATPRHCILWTFIKSEPSLWSGILEFERVAAEDVATGSPVPCWAWTNSLMLGTPFGQAANTAISQIMLAFPRTADGLTGAYAAKVYAPTTNRGMFPPSYPGGTLTISSAADPNLLHLGSYYNMTYGWDTLKTVVSPVAVDAISKSMPLGRSYNVGITKPIGGALDSTNIKIDSVGGWPSASGTSTECLLLPLNGGCEADAAYAVGQFTQFYGQTSAAVLSKPIAIGSTVWLAASDGIRTFDVNAGQGGTTTLRYSNASGVQDIVFDGQQTIYGSISTGVVKIDTESFATTSITNLTSGTSYLNIDQKYVYAVSRTALLSPQCYAINRALFVTSSTYVLGTPLTVASGFGVPVPDYQGSVYLATQGGTVSSQTMRLANYTADTGVQLNGVVNPRSAAATLVTPDSPTSFYIDYASGKIYLAAAFAANGSLYEMTTSLTTSSVAFFATGATGAACQSHLNQAAAVDYRGDLMIVPVRGSFIISPRKVGQISTTVGYAARALFNSPSATVPGTPAAITTLASLNTGSRPLGFASGMSTNSVRLFTTFSSVVASDNRINVNTGIHNVSYTVAGNPNGRLTVKG